jgi:hypothetical protein
MFVKRHRLKQNKTLKERLAQGAVQPREKAEALPPSGAREQIMCRIAKNEAALNLCEMLRSPRLLPAK